MGLSDYKGVFLGEVPIIAAYRGETQVFGLEVVVPLAPSVISPPAISGTATVGSVLTATAGVYGGSPVVTRQWLRNGTAIAGETGLTHTVSSEDVGAVLSLRESAVNAGGTITAASAVLGPVPDPEETAAQTHVFLLAGQSNMVGRATWDNGAAPNAERTFQIARTGALSGAANGEVIAWAHPLDHWATVYAGQMGLDTQFAIDYLAANPNVTLVFVPGARGATGFGSGTYFWGAGNNLSNDAIARTNAYLAANPKAVFKGILWHQGETDGDKGTSGAAYQAVLDTQLAAFRNGIDGAGNAPIVVGELGTFALNAGRLPLQDVISAAPNRIARSACVSSAGLSHGGDNLHFNAAALRVLGSRYCVALAAAAANTTPTATGPGRFGANFWSVAQGSGANQVTLTISGLPGNGGSPITALQYSVDGGTTWTAVGGTATGSYTLSLPEAGTAYAVQLRAVNAHGNGAANDTKTVVSGGTASTLAASFGAGQITITGLGTVPAPTATFGAGQITIIS